MIKVNWKCHSFYIIAIIISILYSGMHVPGHHFIYSNALLSLSRSLFQFLFVNHIQLATENTKRVKERWIMRLSSFFSLILCIRFMDCFTHMYVCLCIFVRACKLIQTFLSCEMPNNYRQFQCWHESDSWFDNKIKSKYLNLYVWYIEYSIYDTHMYTHFIYV